MMKQVVLLLVLALSSVAALKYERCDSGKTQVLSVHVSGCESDERCVLRKRTSPSVNISFIPDREVESATVKVYGVVRRIPVPFGLANSNGCLDSGLTCPLKEAQTYVYKNSIPIESYFPSINFKIRWEMRDAKNEVLYCILADATISS